jgi:hypothetical protein
VPRAARRLRALTALSVLGVLVALLPAPATGMPAADRVTSVAARPARVVVAISVDGLAVGAIRRLGRAATPHLHRMLREGAGTLNARTAVESTVTLPNHTGMLTGRPVRTARGHRVDVNRDPGSTVHRRAGTYVASLFDVVHDRGGSTVLYASKDKFALFDRSWGRARGAPDRVGRDDGRDKIDRYVRDDPAALVGRLVRRLRTAPVEATFLHLRWPDEAGHAHGFLGRPYLHAVRRTDRLLGRVLTAVRSTRWLRRHVDVVLTADHGAPRGRWRHGDRRLRANYTIPFVVWGVDAARGADLYALNPERVRPGRGRPGYRRPPIRNIDLASLVTRLLGHGRVPGGVLPRTTPLEVA